MRLVLTDEFLADNPRDVSEKQVLDFIDQSGVFKTRAGRLIREDGFEVHATIYQARFDSRAWTGL